MEQALNYFKQAEKILNANEFQDEEEFRIFINNVLNEVEGLEYRMACSHDGSNILEKILQRATSFHLRIFFEKIRDKFLDMCCHRYASHVVETWFKSAVLAIQEEDPFLQQEENTADSPPSLEEQLDFISHNVIENFVMLTGDSYGTHIVRKVIQLWSQELDGAPVKFKDCTETILELAHHLSSLPRDIFDLGRAVTSQLISPVLQIFVKVLSKISNEEVEKIYSALFDNDKASLSIDDPVGSHFVEALVQTFTVQKSSEFLRKVIKPQFKQILNGNNANFVLQALISQSPHSASLKSILELLKPHAKDLVDQRKHGVLNRLAKWCVDHELDEAEAIALIIFDAFHLKDTQQKKSAFNCLVRLQTIEKYENNTRDIHVEIGGCQLLQNLAVFPSECAKPIIDGFLDLSVADLLVLCRHASGSRIVEAILASRTVSHQVKQRTIRKLRDHVDLLATDKFASHIVDRLWQLATSELKEIITGKLAEHKTRLQDNQYGRMILRNCRVFEFELNQESWKAAQDSTERKEAMFADILNDDTSSVNLLPDTISAVAKGKRQKKLNEKRRNIGEYNHNNNTNSNDIESFTVDDNNCELLPAGLKTKEKKRKEKRSATNHKRGHLINMEAELPSSPPPPPPPLPISSSAERPEKSWRSMFRWFSAIDSKEGANSEKELLETFGGLDFSDEKKVVSKLVKLPSPVLTLAAKAEEENSYFINTLVIDQLDAKASPTERNNIVLCHGFGAGLGFFYRNLSPLAKMIPNSRIYAMDWLGMGRSGRPAFPMFQKDSTSDTSAAIDFFLDSFEQWRIQQHGLEKFILIGHSMGGYLSALYALRHPDRVQKLLLASPVGLPERTVEEGIAVTGHKLPFWVTRVWNANYTPQGLIRGLGPLGRRFANGYINGRFAYLPQPEKTLLGRYLYNISTDCPSGEYALAALLAPGAWAREPLHKRLPDLAMPCTFLYGQHDWMDKTHADAASEQMIDANVLSVKDAGHQLNIDNPEEFNRMVVQECKKVFSD